MPASPMPDMDWADVRLGFGSSANASPAPSSVHFQSAVPSPAVGSHATASPAAASAAASPSAASPSAASMQDCMTPSGTDYFIGSQSHADSSLLPPGSKAGDNDLWRGWTIQTSQDGKLFYHHSESSTSQWLMPLELEPVLGEWKLVGSGEEGEDGYWRNELLGVSSWKDPRRTTNLFQAALDGNLFFLQLYAEVGGYLDAVDAKGRTALHYNCASGSTQAVLYMLQNKASLEPADQGGSTPLHWASRYGHAPIVRILLEAKADPDRVNSLGDTAMHEAAAVGSVGPLHWLLLAQADALIRNRESRTPAEVAASNGFDEAAKLLSRSSSRRRGSGSHLPDHDALGHTEDESGLESDVHDLPQHPPPQCVTAASAATRSQYESGTESEDEPEPSVALVLVRTARPLLRGVQWIVNRVLGEKKTHLGDENKYLFDEQTGQWVLKSRLRQYAADEGSDSSESGADTWSVPERRPRPPRRPAIRRPRGDSSDAAGGGV